MFSSFSAFLASSRSRAVLGGIPAFFPMRDTSVMAASTRRQSATHEVTNQVPPMTGRTLSPDHPALVGGLGREGGGWPPERLVRAGALWGGEPIEGGRQANENPPVLRTHDRF